MSTADWIGWAATALFAASYLARDARRLRLVQAAAAGVWILYGVMMRAAPVVVANAAVATIALISLWRRRSAPPQQS